MEDKILLLGHKGMLGQMVKSYFESKGLEIITLKNRFEASTKEAFIDEIKAHPDALVINAIGKIKQKTEDTAELLWANAVLPLTLRQILPEDQRLVHPSTDCVFRGDKGEPYSIEDEPDAMDDYGWSKRLGEVALEGRPNTLIPRVSIIGPDQNPNGKGLLNWFIQQPSGSKLQGYTNHLWNGITTLEWCKQIEALLKSFKIGTDGYPFQLGCLGSWTKHEMLQLFNKHYQLEASIVEYQKGEKVDRRLKPQKVSPPLEEQLIELKEF